MEVFVLSHVRYGQGDEDIIFLHGWGGNKSSLKHLADALQNEFSVTVLDFYDFGDSAAPENPLTLQDYADAVLEIVEHYQMKRVTLVNHSFGGRVSIKLAQNPLVEKIIFINSAGMKPRRGFSYHLKIFKHRLYKKYNIGKPQLGSKDYQNLTPTQKQTFNNIINCHLEKEAKLITKPCLLLWGARDTETPLYMAKRLQRKLRGAPLVVFKHAGHFVYIERSNEVLREIKYFLN
jgi:pimeloyl-ACP methyl ester carboxylesterase